MEWGLSLLHDIGKIYTSSLNPCSNGMGIEHQRGLFALRLGKVLILVLMEWGLSDYSRCKGW